MRKQRELLWDVVLALFVLAATAALVRYLGVHDDPVRKVFEAEDAAEERAVQAVQQLHGKIVRAGTEPGKPVGAVDLSNTRLAARRCSNRSGRTVQENCAGGP